MYIGPILKRQATQYVVSTFKKGAPHSNYQRLAFIHPAIINDAVSQCYKEFNALFQGLLRHIVLIARVIFLVESCNIDHASCPLF